MASSLDPYLDHRTRSVQARLPERSSRPVRSPVVIPSGDRYRPPPVWDQPPPLKGSYYRPSYDSYREPPSPGDSYPKDSLSDTQLRTASHSDPPYNGGHLSQSGSSHGSAASSRKRRLGSVSRERAVYDGLSPGTREPVVSQPVIGDVNELLPKKHLSRASSRSSIASTHLSDNAPPPLFQQPENFQSDSNVLNKQKPLSPNRVKTDKVVGGRSAPDDKETMFPNSPRVPANNLHFNKVSVPISVESTLNQNCTKSYHLYVNPAHVTSS